MLSWRGDFRAIVIPGGLAIAFGLWVIALLTFGYFRCPDVLLFSLILLLLILTLVIIRPMKEANKGRAQPIGGGKDPHNEWEERGSIKKDWRSVTFTVDQAWQRDLLSAICSHSKQIENIGKILTQIDANLGAMSLDLTRQRSSAIGGGKENVESRQVLKQKRARPRSDLSLPPELPPEAYGVSRSRSERARYDRAERQGSVQSVASSAIDLQDLADAWKQYRNESSGFFEAKGLQKVFDRRKVSVVISQGPDYQFSEDYLVAVFPGGKEGALFPSFNLAPSSFSQYFHVRGRQRVSRIQNLILPAKLLISEWRAKIVEKGELE